MFDHIKNPNDLITSLEETKAGFVSFALEKNNRSTPYIESAKVLKCFASKAKKPLDLLDIKEIRSALLTASGLSDKSLKYFDDDDKENAIKELIDNFLEPAGDNFVVELVYRYLLIKGDSLGGAMRNIIGTLAERKLLRVLIANLDIQNIDYFWISKNNPNKWIKKSSSDYNIESELKTISWSVNNRYKTLALNLKIPLVKKNIDICLFDCNSADYNFGSIVNSVDKIIMLGELKGGIDPAGADEHWKTANTALQRIHTAFETINQPILTSFVGAAIEKNMAQEIFDQFSKNTLNGVANLTKDTQLIQYCIWLLNL